MLRALDQMRIVLKKIRAKFWGIFQEKNKDSLKEIKRDTNILKFKAHKIINILVAVDECWQPVVKVNVRI